jgi:monoamine oxidase
MNHVYEVIVVGAGAAGLGCAERLSRQGVDFLMLEARDRVGGRVYSITEEQLPIELGAEFVHGLPKKIIALLEGFKIPFYEVSDEHLYFKGKKLIPLNDFWERMEKIMSSLKRKSDHSICEFIKRKKLSPDDRKLFLSFIEGFHAADTNVLGEEGLSDTNQNGEDGIFRLTTGYSTIFTRIAETFAKRLHLCTELKKIDWERGRVQLTCNQGPSQTQKIYECKKVVLTLPIGVLKSTAIQWNKKPAELDAALGGVHMGHVQRIVFRFRNRFWEEQTSFMHTGDDQYFPTWWSLRPMHSKYLVAWQGGPKALEMANWPVEERINSALMTLAKLTRQPLRIVNAEVEKAHTHNWTKDIWSRGAYSYIGVNGLTGAQRLQKPFGDTLYLAGEGCAKTSGRGTVHGAYQSGNGLAFAKTKTDTDEKLKGDFHANL